MNEQSYHAFLLACQTIGSVSGSNGRFQELLFSRVGDDWTHLGMLDVVALIAKARSEFNRMERIARGEA